MITMHKNVYTCKKNRRLSIPLSVAWLVKDVYSTWPGIKRVIIQLCNYIYHNVYINNRGKFLKYKVTCNQECIRRGGEYCTLYSCWQTRFQ